MIAVCDRMAARSTTRPPADHQEHPSRVGHRSNQDLASNIQVLFRRSDHSRAGSHATGAARDTLELARGAGRGRGWRRRRARDVGQHDAASRHPRRQSRPFEGVVLVPALRDQCSKVARDRRPAHRTRDLVDREIEHIVRLVDQPGLCQPRFERAHHSFDHAEGAAPHEPEVLAVCHHPARPAQQPAEDASSQPDGARPCARRPQPFRVARSMLKTSASRRRRRHDRSRAARVVAQQLDRLGRSSASGVSRLQLLEEAISEFVEMPQQARAKVGITAVAFDLAPDLVGRPGRKQLAERQIITNQRRPRRAAIAPDGRFPSAAAGEGGSWCSVGSPSCHRAMSLPTIA